MNTYKKLETCLCCGSSKIRKFIDLGSQALVNNLLDDKGDNFLEFPLEVNYCESCWHSQLSVSVNPSILFKDYYYVTGTSKTMQKYCEELSNIIYNRVDKKEVKILDIASNDGTFLSKFKKFSWDLFGVDPAKNLKKVCESKGIKTFVNFFGAEKIDFKTKFDVITALNVFAHVNDPINFLKECKKNLKQDGLIVIQTSHRDMVEKRQFDTAYHEHVSFFSVNSMKTVCRNSGLFLNDLFLPSIHGDSYVFFISNDPSESINLKKRIKHENKVGRYSKNLYKTFQNDIEKVSLRLKNKLINKKFIAFGAAAKGIVSLQALNLNPEIVIDENPLKVNKIIPKKNIPIVTIQQLESYKEPLDILILPWNFEKEIKEKIINIRGNMDNIFTIF
jgi:SAM-dependent methyltransferase